MLEFMRLIIICNRYIIYTFRNNIWTHSLTINSFQMNGNKIWTVGKKENQNI